MRPRAEEPADARALILAGIEDPAIIRYRDTHGHLRDGLFEAFRKEPGRRNDR